MSRGLAPEQLLAAAQQLVERCSTALLLKNDVGNLSICDGGEYLGWLDLRTGAVHMFTDETDEP